MFQAEELIFGMWDLEAGMSRRKVLLQFLPDRNLLVGEKKGEREQRRQPKPQKPNANQKRGQSQLIIEDTSVRAKIGSFSARMQVNVHYSNLLVPQKIPKNAFPTLDGTYVEEVERKDENLEQRGEEKPVESSKPGTTIIFFFSNFSYF